MITHATNKLPLIEWEQGEKVEDECDSNTTFHIAHGYTRDDRYFKGLGEVFCGRLVSVTHIEEIKTATHGK